MGVSGGEDSDTKERVVDEVSMVEKELVVVEVFMVGSAARSRVQHAQEM
jgi:hypothetical protein